MVSAISDYCRQTGQLVPDSRPLRARHSRKPRLQCACVIEALESLVGSRFEEIRIVGGGSRTVCSIDSPRMRRCTVVAGPVEATALGNIAMQMLATGAVSSLDEARHIIERSFPVERFEPQSADAWNAQYARFQDYVEMTCV